VTINTLAPSIANLMLRNVHAMLLDNALAIRYVAKNCGVDYKKNALFTFFKGFLSELLKK
jgi:hypothetical protein